MADLQVLPVKAEDVIGSTGVWASPNFTERVPRVSNGVQTTDFYREFEVSGDKQHNVVIRVYGENNSDQLPKKALQQVQVEGLKMVVRAIQSRGQSKREIAFEASSLRVKK